METLELFNEKVVCPLCREGGGGSVYSTMLFPINKLVYICDECEATWLNSEDVGSNRFFDFTTYVNHLGYQYQQIKLNDKNYYWYKN